MAGIFDYEQKLKAIAILLGVEAEPLAIISAVHPVDDKLPPHLRDTSYVANGKLADRFRHWATSVPKQDVYPFLTKMLDKAEVVGLEPDKFISCSFDTFLENAPPEKAKMLQHLRRNRGRNDEHWMQINVNNKVAPMHIAEGLRNAKFIDHKYCYLTAHAVMRWYDFINEDNYPLFKTCLNGLKKFLQGDLWNGFLADRRFGGVVILGAGAPSKDKRILESILEKRSKDSGHFLYSIVDFSSFMIQETQRALAPMLANREKPPKISGVAADFTDFAASGSELLRPEGRSVAWFVLGNTLGNLDEEKFFQSVRDVSLPGDMLIVGNELLPEIIPGDLDEKLKKEYELDSVEHFFREPLAAWRDSQSSRTFIAGLFDQSLKKRDVRVVHGYQIGLSRIDGSRTVVVEVNVGGDPLVLLKSTRYDYNKLCDCARHYRFEPRETEFRSNNYGPIAFVRI